MLLIQYITYGMPDCDCGPEYLADNLVIFECRSIPLIRRDGRIIYYAKDLGSKG